MRWIGLSLPLVVIVILWVLSAQISMIGGLEKGGGVTAVGVGVGTLEILCREDNFSDSWSTMKVVWFWDRNDDLVSDGEVFSGIFSIEHNSEGFELNIPIWLIFATYLTILLCLFANQKVAKKSE